jgi:hypothetical protein
MAFFLLEREAGEEGAAKRPLRSEDLSNTEVGADTPSRCAVLFSVDAVLTGRVECEKAEVSFTPNTIASRRNNKFLILCAKDSVSVSGLVLPAVPEVFFARTL